MPTRPTRLLLCAFALIAMAAACAGSPTTSAADPVGPHTVTLTSATRSVATSAAVSEEPAVVTGRVANAQGRPHEGVLVRIPQLNVGSASGADGTYWLAIPASRIGSGSTVQLTAAGAGMTVSTYDVALSRGVRWTQDFQMQAAVALVEGVLD